MTTEEVFTVEKEGETQILLYLSLLRVTTL